jgi:hypothetical protein
MSDPTDPSNPASYSGYAEPAAPATGYQPPAAATPPAAPAPVLLVRGDVSVTQFHVITPTGTHPLNGTSWYVTDNSTVEQVTPQWAIIAAIVGFFIVCALSLLFLLVKEPKATGSVQLTIQGPGWSHVTQLAPGTGAHAESQAAYVRQLVAALPA